MTWTLIESDHALEVLLEDASKLDAVAIDTEFMRRNTFYPQVALLQICFAGEAWLIDPLKIREPEALVDFMLNPGIVKILHSASEDLEVFQQWLGVLPEPLFDTQRAAALVGRGFGMGYRALVEDICGVQLDKGETRSDWLARPLSQSQCEYAGQDVTHLLEVWRVLKRECDEQDKTDWVFADGADAVDALASNSMAYYRKIKSAWKLNARQLAGLVAICGWREKTARQKDKPRSWIIDDKACFELASSAPNSWPELKQLEHIPSSSLRRYGDELLAILAGQQSLAEADLPLRLPAPLGAQQRNTLKSLKQKAREIAESLSVSPEALLASKDYEILVREAAGELVTAPAQWQGWRAEIVLAPLRKMLAEQSA